MNFKRYEKVGKLYRVETEGILSGTCYIQPKLDGTNGSMWWGGTSIYYGSRNRGLSADDDNAGFMNHHMKMDRYSMYLLDHPSHRLFGEWLVPHTFKGYQDDAWRHFYVYDIFDEENHRWLLPEEYYGELTDREMYPMPFAKLNSPSKGDVGRLLENVSNYLVKGGTLGEGIVIKNYDYRNKFGVCVYAKHLNEEFTASTGRVKGKVVRSCPVEEELAERMVDRGLILKTQSKIEVMRGGYSQRNIPQLLETVWHDAIEEELYSALKDMKWPTVNFKALKGQVIQRIKIEGKEFF